MPYTRANLLFLLRLIQNKTESSAGGEFQATGLNEFKKYCQRYSRFGPMHGNAHMCNDSTKKKRLCQLVTGNSKDIPTKSIECRKIESLVDGDRQIKKVFWIRIKFVCQQTFLICEFPFAINTIQIIYFYSLLSEKVMVEINDGHNILTKTPNSTTLE